MSILLLASTSLIGSNIGSPVIEDTNQSMLYGGYFSYQGLGPIPRQENRSESIEVRMIAVSPLENPTIAKSLVCQQVRKYFQNSSDDESESQLKRVNIAKFQCRRNNAGRFNVSLGNKNSVTLVKQIAEILNYNQIKPRDWNCYALASQELEKRLNLNEMFPESEKRDAFKAAMVDHIHTKMVELNNTDCADFETEEDKTLSCVRNLFSWEDYMRMISLGRSKLPLNQASNQ